VVLTNLRPGKHAIHGLAQMGTDSYNWIINLMINASDTDIERQWTGIQKIP
jgi:hypothetical protein